MHGSFPKIHWDLSGPYVRTQHAPTKLGQALLGSFNEVRFRSFNEVRLRFFPAPSFGSPFISSLAHTFPFLFLFMYCLPSRLVTSSLSFFLRTHRFSAHVRSYMKTRSEVAQVVKRRFGSSVVSVHLVPFHRSHIHLSCHVFFSCLRPLVFCARTRTSLNLGSRLWPPHLEGVCVKPSESQCL